MVAEELLDGADDVPTELPEQAGVITHAARPISTQPRLIPRGTEVIDPPCHPSAAWRPAPDASGTGNFVAARPTPVAGADEVASWLSGSTLACVDSPGANRRDDPEHHYQCRESSHHEPDRDPDAATDAAGLPVDPQCHQRAHRIEGNVRGRSCPARIVVLLRRGANLRCRNNVALAPQAAVRAVGWLTAGRAVGKVHA